MPEVAFEGKSWVVYLFRISDFESDLDDLGRFLEEIEDRGEKVFAIIPNIGYTSTSFFSQISGVTGFAIISRKK